MKRKQFIRTSMMAAAGTILYNKNQAQTIPSLTNEFPVVRVEEAKRHFKSKSVEALIADVRKHIKNPEIGWLFENCFPNTLDTTVYHSNNNGKPDTYVITGDIDAMWLRDSSAQVWPYLLLCKQDKELQELIKGVINRQVFCILKDPYANAFYKDDNQVSEWKETDKTDMKAGIHERKWEIDSLCYTIRLAHGYWKETGDTSVFDEEWTSAMKAIIKTFKEQQRFNGLGPYKFERVTSWATDGVAMGGYGYPAKPNGLICSSFRPSDDATVYSYLIPSNFFAVTSLRQMAILLKLKQGHTETANEALALATQVENALKKEAIYQHPKYGPIYAYEVNGFGSYNLMDDANIPSLLSLPYLSGIPLTDKVYQNTRKYVLSLDNPFFFKGSQLEGIGGPHIGLDMVWPMSIIMRGLTTTSEAEISACIKMLQKSHAGTGFMHESAHKDDVSKFTRKWFAWTNTIFGEFIWKTYREKKHLLV